MVKEIGKVLEVEEVLVMVVKEIGRVLGVEGEVEEVLVL